MILDYSNLRIFVRPGFTDMRKQIDGLAALVQEAMGLNALDGSLYLFAGMGGRRLKILYWDRNGFCLWQKRLHQDAFPWPRDESTARAISLEQLELLLQGIDFWRAHKPRNFKSAV